MRRTRVRFLAAPTKDKVIMKTIKVKPKMTKKEGVNSVIKKALRDGRGDIRGATYNPKTGKGKVG